MVCTAACIPKCQCPTDKPVFHDGKCVDEQQCFFESLGFVHPNAAVTTAWAAATGATVAAVPILATPGAVVGTLSIITVAASSIVSGAYAYYNSNHDNWKDGQELIAIRDGIKAGFVGARVVKKSGDVVLDLLESVGDLATMTPDEIVDTTTKMKAIVCGVDLIGEIAVIAEIANKIC